MHVMEKIISLVAPHTCLKCDSEGSLVCSGCRVMLGADLPSRCYLCYKSTPDNSVCSACKRKSSLKSVWVRCVYTDIAKQLVRAIKYSRAQNGTKIIAQELKNALPSSMSEYVIVPIPTANTRKRQRGYDHAQLIARELATALDVPCQELLLRLGTSRQVGSKREDRLRQLDGAFMCKKNKHLKVQKILLIDDVVTTGATIEAAARELRQNGYRDVSAAVFAQA